MSTAYAEKRQASRVVGARGSGADDRQAGSNNSGGAAGPGPDLRAANMRGMQFPAGDLTFQSDIQGRGKWHGRGAAVVADLANHYQEHYARAKAADWADGAADRRARVACCGLVCHEFAHQLPDGDAGKDSPIGGDAATARAGFLRFATAGPSKTVEVPERAPWVAHDANFIRAALHLWDRCRQRWVEELRPDDVVDSRLATLWDRRLRQLRCLHYRFDCFRLERPVAGLDLHSRRTNTLSRRTE